LEAAKDLYTMKLDRIMERTIDYYRLREEGFEVRDFLYEVEIREAANGSNEPGST